MWLPGTEINDHFSHVRQCMFHFELKHVSQASRLVDVALMRISHRDPENKDQRLLNSEFI